MKKRNKIIASVLAILTFFGAEAYWLRDDIAIKIADARGQNTPIVKPIEYNDRAVIVVGRGDPFFYSEKGREDILEPSLGLYNLFSSNLGKNNVSFFVPQQMMCKLPSGVETTGPDTKESVDSAIESSAKNARNLYIILMETPLRERDALLNDVGENPWINLDGGEYSSRELLPAIKDGCQESTILIENIADYGNYLRGLTGIPIWQIGPFIRFAGLRESAGTGVVSATYGSYAPAFISGIATNPNYNWRAPRNLLAFAVNPYDSKGRMFGRGLVERYKESPAQSLQDLLKPDLSSGLYVNEKGDLEPINESPAYEDPLFKK